MNQEFAFSRIGYVYVPTSNIDESIAWYTRNLSFKLMDKFQDRGSFLAVLHHPHQHSIALLLIETADGERLAINRNGKPFPIMALNCPDIMSVVFLLLKLGRIFITPKIVFRRDPKLREVYKLSFLSEEIRFEAGELKSTFPWTYYIAVKESRDFIFMYYDTSPLRRYYCPKSALYSSFGSQIDQAPSSRFPSLSLK